MDWLPGRVWHQHWDRISTCGRLCQVVLEEVNIFLCMALMVFFQSFGGAIFTSVTESIFLNGLESKLHEIAPTFDASMLLRTGATDLTRNVLTSLPSIIQESYNSALAHVWSVSVALSATSIIAAFGIGWRRIQPWAGLGATDIRIHLVQVTLSTSFHSVVLFLIRELNGFMPCIQKLRCV